MKKLHNIAHYCAVTDIKPELTHVLVTKTSSHITTTATDSYRLASITYSFDDHPLLEQLEEGLYHYKYFHTLAMAYNKQKAGKPIDDVLRALLAFKAVKSDMKVSSYPEFSILLDKINRAIEKGEATEGIKNKYNHEYLMEHIKLCGDLIEMKNYSSLDISKMMETPHGAMVFEHNGNYALLMRVNN